MMLKGAAPILDEQGKVLGVLAGGILLNQNYEIVDRVKEIVFKGEKYKGKEIGPSPYSRTTCASRRTSRTPRETGPSAPGCPKRSTTRSCSGSSLGGPGLRRESLVHHRL